MSKRYNYHRHRNRKKIRNRCIIITLFLMIVATLIVVPCVLAANLSRQPEQPVDTASVSEADTTSSANQTTSAGSDAVASIAGVGDLITGILGGETQSQPDGQSGGYDPVDEATIEAVRNGDYKGMIAITFDDGPNANTTAEMLDLLEREQIPATFFMLGQNVAANESLLPRMIAAGCELGTHSWDHTDLTSVSDEELKAQISRSEQAVYNACGVYPTVFRAPYGKLNEKIEANLKVPSIYWTVDTMDWQSKDPGAIRREIVSSAYDGAIILMHDIYDSTVKGFSAAIQDLRNEGYAFVTVSTLLRRNGEEPKAGVTYYDNEPA